MLEKEFHNKNKNLVIAVDTISHNQPQSLL